MPIRKLMHTFPVVGIVIAISAGAASVALIELAETALRPLGMPGHAGVLFLPEVAAAAAGAVLLGVLFTTRYVPVLAFAGLLTMTGGAGVLTGVASGSDAIALAGSGLVGMGVGASVSPALFLAGLSLRSAMIQRVFALIELLRGVAAFMIAPVLVHVAMTAGGGPKTGGIELAVWIALGIGAAGALAAAALWRLGGARLQRPDIERWLGGEAPALESPPLLAALRGSPAPSRGSA
jgi:hypothetical protein